MLQRNYLKMWGVLSFMFPLPSSNTVLERREGAMDQYFFITLFYIL